MSSPTFRLLLAMLAASTLLRAEESPAGFWLDLLEAEETPAEAVYTDLAGAGAIYVGEAHTIPRHHALQLLLLQEVAARNVPLVLCFEQLEARDQPAIDRYNRGEIDLDALAKEINWAKKWKNYTDYVPLVKFAREHGIPVRGLNAPAETIRAVSRGGGVAKLPADQRALIATDINLDDPVYERQLNLQLAVHMAMDPAKLRPVFEAQVSRDETMAQNIHAARRVDAPADKPRTAFVIIGAGHVRHGLGTPDRVRRRDPGIVERIVLMTESGQLKLSDADKAQVREITITHGNLRDIGRPPGDYLHVLPLAEAKAK